MDLTALTAYLHHEIPLTRAMQLTVARADAESVHLRFPLAPNDNHKGSAFGGSLSTAATLAAWTLLHVRLKTAGIAATVVIQNHRIDYLQPVLGDFSASARTPDQASWDTFVQILSRRGRARIQLEAVVECEGRQASVFTGQFVAFASEAA